MKAQSIVFIIISVFLSISLDIRAQEDVSYTKTPFLIKKIKSFDPRDVEPSFRPTIKNLEAPIPGGNSYRSHLLDVKKEVRKKYPISTNNSKANENSKSVASPTIVDSFALKEFIYVLNENGDTNYVIVGGDTLFPSVRYLFGGPPLDNTLAVSNDDFLMCAVNSDIYMHDLKTGQNPKRADINVISFEDFANEEGNLATDFPFDPKIIYDPEEDKFVLTFLTGRGPSSSALILAFSTSNNPNDPWNVYKLPGNPYDNGLWSDYPAISLSNDELFYTINLLVPGSDWKVSFSETVIWQIDKYSGYAGDSILKSDLWGNVAHNGRNLRNLAVVHGGEGLEGPNMYFLSNRNFDVTNDTTFLVEITDKIDNSATMKITPLISAQPYGVPPNGRQVNSNPNDPDDGFDTNDARVLGAYKNQNQIQFVGNSVDNVTGRAAVYHGVINNLDSEPTLKANIIGDDSLDFGYPNIVFTGADNCSGNTSLIAFDHTSPDHYAGVSALKFEDDENAFGSYSELITLKEGLDYVDQHSTTYERWGDYFGLQRKFDEPGVVYSAGFFGTEVNKSAGTWYTKLRDCECLDTDINEVILSVYNKCDGQIVANVTNGIEPINFNWNGDDSPQNYMPVNLCDYEYNLIVTDNHGCNLIVSDTVLKNNTIKNNTIFPNPSKGDVNLYFELSRETTVTVHMYNMEGKVVYELVNGVKAQSGKNLLTFSLDPLPVGVYFIKILDGDNEILTEKLLIQ